MAKQGMKRIERTKKPKNDQPPVPEIEGPAKHGKECVDPIIAGSKSPSLKVYHTVPYSKKEPSFSSAYSEIYTDLAIDNLENDISKADLQDL